MEKIVRNCNSCKLGLFGRCDALKNNEEYQAIWKKAESERGFLGTLDAHKFKENYCCDEYKCRYIEYPIEVSAIERNTSKEQFTSYRTGAFVAVRPCIKDEPPKTHLGLLVGELPIDVTISRNPETKVLNVGYMLNPAIFVPDLNRLVFGMESWWHTIETESDLKEITDYDIQNTWYVKALESLDDMVLRAERVATKAHVGQVDKAGAPYIEHPRFVASQMETREEKAVAWLHDVPEDTEVSVDDLATDFPDEVIEALIAITKTNDEAYEEYLQRVKANPIARAVKLADLSHNMMIERIPQPSDKDYARVNKYRQSHEYLLADPV